MRIKKRPQGLKVYDAKSIINNCKNCFRMYDVSNVNK